MGIDNGLTTEQALQKGVAAHREGKLQDAERLYRAILQSQPAHPDANHNLGVIAVSVNKADAALPLFKTALEANPKIEQFWLSYIDALIKTEKFDDARRVLSDAQQAGVTDANAWTNLGVAFQQEKRITDAKIAYEKALALNPKSAAIVNNLGAIAKETEEWESALQHFSKAVEIEPNLAEAHKNLAMVLIMKGLTESALQHLQINFELERGAKPVKPRHKSFTNTSKAKIDHDIEQFEYLAASGYDIKKFSELAAVYKIVSSEIDCVSDTDIVPLSDKHLSLLGDTFNRSIHMLEAPALEGSTIGDGFDVNKITENYFEHEFGLTYVDELLSPTALKSLRDFLLGSTIWYDFFHNGGYIGAYLSEGLASPLVLQIAEDLRKKFPKIFKNHQLTQLWAYKYDSRASKKNNSFKGINVHADFAAINVNFWITPKAANLDKSSGGLVVYNTEAPLEWDFKIFNRNDEKILEEISKQGGKKDIIPYNDNRAVIFNSNLFHETDTIDFKDGYENRRINVTILFGRREENHE